MISVFVVLRSRCVRMNTNAMLEKTLARTRNRFDRAVAAYKATAAEYPEETTAIAANWRGFRDVCGAMGGDFLPRYDLPGVDDVIGTMEFISHFVNHEVYDDGMPGVVWFRRDIPTLPLDATRGDILRARIRARIVPCEPEQGEIPVLIDLNRLDTRIHNDQAVTACRMRDPVNCNFKALQDALGHYPDANPDELSQWLVETTTTPFTGPPSG